VKCGLVWGEPNPAVTYVMHYPYRLEIIKIRIILTICVQLTYLMASSHPYMHKFT